MRPKQRSLLWLMLLCAVMLLGAPSLVLALGQATYPGQTGTVIEDVVILTGLTSDALIVADGGVLVLLGVSLQDIVVEPGGEAYIYGMVVGNVLNYGGLLEIYGFAGGYIYTDSDGSTIVDPDSIVIATPPPVTPTPFPTPTPGTPTPTSTPVLPTPTPVPTATPAPATGAIDLSISLYKSASTPAERAPYEDILGHFADAIYEMTNGAQRVREVTIYADGGHARAADVVWTTQEWPCAYVNGYGVPGYSVYMGDLFNTIDFTVDRRCGGYALAHEWGHYYYGVYDEYRSSPDNLRGSSDSGCPQSDDSPVNNSVMNDPWRACIDGDFNWLNFSIPKNQTRNNAQYRVFNASAWETLARSPSQDPRNAARMALRERSFFPELVGFAPSGNNNASLELVATDASQQARALLNITWADDATTATANLTATSPDASSSLGGINLVYQGMIESVLGDILEYPKPLLLVARVINGVPIAKANVSAGVLLPDRTMLEVSLKDDGLPPDVLADDGLYSGFVPYTQAGTYYAFVRFDNRTGLAEFTEESLHHAPGPNGEMDYPAPQLVGEEFYAVANTVITVANVRADDHGNTSMDATSLTPDNVALTGRIDYANDTDMFEVIPSGDGKLTLRLSDFAFDMQPRVQIFRTDGATLIKSFEFTPENNQYFFTSLRGKANEPFYVAVQHLDATTVGGIYDISIGPRLPNVVESPPFSVLFILLPVGAFSLGVLYLLAHPRKTVRKTVAPQKRAPTQPITRRPSHETRPGGSNIYKSDGEQETKENSESD